MFCVKISLAVLPVFIGTLTVIVAYEKKINLCVVSKGNCCLVVTCWERVDLLALVCDFYCDFVTFPFGILGKVWNLIASIPYH